MPIGRSKPQAMGKATHPIKAEAHSTRNRAIVLPEFKDVDVALASLFASSSGPVKVPILHKSSSNKSNLSSQPHEPEHIASIDINNPDASNDRPSPGSSSETIRESAVEDQEALLKLLETDGKPKLSRKRKRKGHDNVEDEYMRKLAAESDRDRNTSDQASPSNSRRNIQSFGNQDVGENDTSASDFDDDSPDVILHESLKPADDEDELEKASRTVFLANVSTNAITSKAAKKALHNHLSSFLPTLNSRIDDTPMHAIKSLRFRSTAFSNSAAPKKAAFARKDLMDTTTKSTNAYVVYTTPAAAREAVKLNGSIILDRHLRVDNVAHPAKTDHRRCVFVGNLAFVDDNTAMNDDGNGEGGRDPKKRKKEPADVEEGLWRQFGKAGEVESVRVIRDPLTRVGKGFAYVQFKDGNAVEAALLFNDKKFPPLLPRVLRVTRAKSTGKKPSASVRPDMKRNGSTSGQIYKPKTSSQESSLRGRAGKLLGHAGAARLNNFGTNDNPAQNVSRKPEDFVFEGHRASSKNGKAGIKMKGSGKNKKKKGKPQTRSSKRGSLWKSSGGKQGSS